MKPPLWLSVPLLLLAIVVVLLTGCQPATQLTPHISHPARDLATTPHVEFMGDSQIMAVVAYANNPMWKCTTCVADQLSAAVLSEVPSVIALHPDLVVVQAGARDLEVDPTERDAPLSANVQAIVMELQAANIPVLVCLVPNPTPESLYDPYYFNTGMDFLNQAGIVPAIFAQAGPEDDLLTGIDYNQNGLTVVYPLLEAAVQEFGLGGTK